MSDEIAKAIKKNLTDDLRKPEYRGHKNKYHGHCYVASEAYYWLTPHRWAFTPMYVQHEGTTHWYLRNDIDGKYVDLTARQFSSKVPYSRGTACGFLTKWPSKRAQELIQRVWRTK